MPYQPPLDVENYLQSIRATRAAASPKASPGVRRPSVWARAVSRLRRLWPFRLVLAILLASAVGTPGCAVAAPPPATAATTRPSAGVTVELLVVKQLQPMLAKLVERLGTLRSQVDAVREAQSNDGATIAAVDGQVAELRSSVEGIAADLRNIALVTQRLVTQVDGVGAGQVQTVARASELRTQIVRGQAEVERLASEVAAARAEASDQHVELVDAVSTATRSLTGRLAQSGEALGAKVGQLRDRADAQQRITQQIQNSVESARRVLLWLGLGNLAIGLGACALFFLLRPTRSTKRFNVFRPVSAAKGQEARAQSRKDQQRVGQVTRMQPEIVRAVQRGAVGKGVEPIADALVSVSTHQGHVRSKNDDRGRNLVIGPYRVLVVADGMGGLPFGADAAEAAVEGVAIHLGRVLQFTFEAVDLQSAALGAVAAAQRAIELLVSSRPELETGCRTTLIVTLFDTRSGELAYAHIGDGGGFRHSKDGVTEHFVLPMKEAGSSAIWGSLGPMLDGNPRAGSLFVHPGDLILVGTDGILDFNTARNDFEYVAAIDVAGYVRSATEELGDLDAAVAQVVEGYVNYRDPVRQQPVLDDNATIGAMLVATSELSQAA